MSLSQRLRGRVVSQEKGSGNSWLLDAYRSVTITCCRSFLCRPDGPEFCMYAYVFRPLPTLVRGEGKVKLNLPASAYAPNPSQINFWVYSYNILLYG